MTVSMYVCILHVGTLSWMLHDEDWYSGLAVLLPPGDYPDSTRFPGGANRVSSAMLQAPSKYNYEFTV